METAWPLPCAPCCEIRTLVLHVYPDGIKAYGHEHLTTLLGGMREKRAEPVS